MIDIIKLKNSKIVEVIVVIVLLLVVVLLLLNRVNVLSSPTIDDPRVSLQSEAR